jgi:hypothetical protein
MPRREASGASTSPTPYGSNDNRAHVPGKELVRALIVEEGT